MSNRSSRDNNFVIKWDAIWKRGRERVKDRFLLLHSSSSLHLVKGIQRNREKMGRKDEVKERRKTEIEWERKKGKRGKRRSRFFSPNIPERKNIQRKKIHDVTCLVSNESRKLFLLLFSLLETSLFCFLSGPPFLSSPFLSFFPSFSFTVVELVNLCVGLRCSASIEFYKVQKLNQKERKKIWEKKKRKFEKKKEENLRERRFERKK